MSRSPIGSGPPWKSIVFGMSLVLLCLCLPASPAGSSEARGKEKWAQGEVLYKLKYLAGFNLIDQIHRESDADLHEEIAEIGFDTLRRVHSRSRTTEDLIRALSRNPLIEYVEPNYVVSIDQTTPNDPSYSQLWGLTRIGAAAAWDVTTGTGDVVVGVVDTGVDYTHADLAANTWSNSGVINGCPAGTHGYNAINRTCDPMDDNNHGTHVSGTIGAVGNNGTGVVGVNWNTRIMGLKFLDQNGSGYTSNAIAAIDWAVRARQSGVNLRVLNNSWGGGGYSQALKDVIDKAGANDILFVAAAGNNASSNDASPTYPASYGTANGISVAATTSSDGLASFSNWGATSVDLGAPGESILSTVRGNGYAFYSGTSMATPHVTGAAALILSACSQTVSGVKSTILGNIDSLAALAGKVKTGGRLNVDKAIRTCSAPDFSLSAAPSSVSASPGGTVTYAVTILRTAGFSGDVSFSVGGLPANAVASFNPSPSGGTSSTLTVTVDSATSVGSYSFTVTGTGGNRTHTASAALVVQKPDFSLGISPSSARVGTLGGRVSYKVTITRTGGFTGAVSLSVTGLPSGASASFNPSSATGTSSTLTITVASSAANKQYPFTVTGTNDTMVLRSVSATLVKGR